MSINQYGDNSFWATNHDHMHLSWVLTWGDVLETVGVLEGRAMLRVVMMCFVRWNK